MPVSGIPRTVQHHTKILITLHFRLCYTLSHNTNIAVTFHFIATILLVYHHYFHLYIHAGSPNVTSLTFDDQSRTLTCTSTGGPAAIVTWRRNGVGITRNATHQKTKRVVDPVNGTYQTVLTINSSVDQSDIVGTYSCTVDNARGDSSETVVVPGETYSLTTENRWRSFCCC